MKAAFDNQQWPRKGAQSTKECLRPLRSLTAIRWGGPASLDVERWTLNVERSRRCNAFTLVELLTVLVIIGIIAGLGLTAMNHIGRAQALQSGARQFANDITMARQYAIVNSTYLYLVVATRDTTNAVEYPYSSYGFCVPVSGSVTSAVNSNAEVAYIDDIRYLPKGVVFDTNTVFTDSSDDTISFPNDGTAQQKAWIVTFTPNGQIEPLARRPSFTLIEGIFDTTTSYPKRTGVSTNQYRIEINSLIGKPIVTKLP